jgi:cytochrome bd-type quinol oxidase subunit 1
VLIAIPDPRLETNDYAIQIPVLGSLIGSMSFDSKEVGLTDFPMADRPPMIIPFFAFHGWLRPHYAVAGLGWILSEYQRKHRTKPSVALGYFSKLSTAIHRHIGRMVHCGRSDVSPGRFTAYCGPQIR